MGKLLPKRKRTKTPGTKKRKINKTLILLVVAVIALLAVTIYYYWKPTPTEDSLKTLLEDSKCRVLILDPLSQELPNPKLIGRLVEVFSRANCSVTLLEGKSFTVKQVGFMNYYDVVIFRGHTGWRNDVRIVGGEKEVTTYVALYTGEPFSKDKYPELLSQGYIGEGIPLTQIGAESNRTYIAVTQYYLEKVLGSFPANATIILSTCFSAMTEHLAKVFFEKGAARVIGWSEKVSISHADRALELLVEKVFLEKKSWSEAVREVDVILGPDPAYNSTLEILENK